MCHCHYHGSMPFANVNVWQCDLTVVIPFRWIDNTRVYDIDNAIGMNWQCQSCRWIDWRWSVRRREWRRRGRHWRSSSRRVRAISGRASLRYRYGWGALILYYRLVDGRCDWQDWIRYRCDWQDWGTTLSIVYRQLQFILIHHAAGRVRMLGFCGIID